MRNRLGLTVRTTLALFLLLPACQGAAGGPATPGPVTGAAAAWPDAVLYFVDRRPLRRRRPRQQRATSTVTAKGTFHGGDLEGLDGAPRRDRRPRRDRALDHPGRQEHRRLRHRRGLPRLGLPRLLGRRLPPARPALRERRRSSRRSSTTATRRGIRVLLDVVYNHAGYESQLPERPADQGLAAHRTRRGTCGAGRPHLVRRRACPTSGPRLPRSREYLLTPQLGLRAAASASTASASTPSSTSTTRSGQEHRAADPRRGRARASSSSARSGAATPQVLDPWFDRRRDGRRVRLRLPGERARRSSQGRGRAVAFDRYLKSREKVRAGLPPRALPLLARRARRALPARRRTWSSSGSRRSCS